MSCCVKYCWRVRTGLLILLLFRGILIWMSLINASTNNAANPKPKFFLTFAQTMWCSPLEGKCLANDVRF